MAPAGLKFFVPGTPITKGSLRQFHRWQPNGKCRLGIAEQGGARLEEWRALVATAAKRATKNQMPLAGPLKVDLTFYFRRPASHTAAERLIPWVAVHKRNDLDKLGRAIFDALVDSAVMYDDAQVVRVEAEKRYADDEDRPGVLIGIEAL